MLPSVLIIIVAVFVFTVVMQLGMRWVGKLIGADVETRLRSAQTIVEDHTVPESWIHNYRRRIDTMRSQGKSQKAIDKVGKKALAHCLKQVDDVMFFFTRVNVADSPIPATPCLQNCAASGNAG